MTDLEAAIYLWSTTPPYRNFPCKTIAWRLLPALEHDQYQVFWRDTEPYGLITWAWMTRAEFETRIYHGPTVFARRSGEVMVFLDMIAPKGRSDVLYICREMRKLFKTRYPEAKVVLAHRGRRVGSFPNKGG